MILDKEITIIDADPDTIGEFDICGYKPNIRLRFNSKDLARNECS